MSCDFKPGDEVVCVDEDPCVVHGKPAVRTGNIYTVRDVTVEHNFSGFAVYLHEVRSSGPKGGFCSSRFRKVQKRDASLSIETFLTIKPGYEEPRRPAVPSRKRERV